MSNTKEVRILPVHKVAGQCFAVLSSDEDTVRITAVVTDGSIYWETGFPEVVSLASFLEAKGELVGNFPVELEVQ